MADIKPSGLDPIQNGAETASSKKAKKTTPDGPAFRVLLEQLQTKAQELEKTSQRVNDPNLLAGAVDTARTSLEDAVTLSDRILEAFHEARQQADVPPGPEGDSKTESDKEETR